MIEIASDPVYIKMCQRFKRATQEYLFCDPYYRYGRILQHLAKASLIPLESNILDLGCLRPELASLLIGNFRARVTGIDQWQMSEAWPDVPLKYYQFNLEDDFATALKLEGKYDLVFALEVLEHMIDTDAFIRRVRLVLKDGGVLIISTPNLNSLRNRILVPLGEYPAFLEYKNIIHHVRLYNLGKLKSHLAEHSFEVLASFGVNFLPMQSMRFKPYRRVSGCLADAFPSLCPNLVVVARK